MLKLKNATPTEVARKREQSWAAGQRARLDHALTTGEIRGFTTYGVWMKVPAGYAGPQQYLNDLHVDWFDEYPLEVGDRIYLPAAHNLAVDSGLHISAQRTFVTTADADLTPESGSTNDGVRYGGVDNNTTAVVAGTSQFDTTSSNRFIALFESDPSYSTANKRITSTLNITNSDTTIVHRRYGVGNDSANAANTLFSMLSGFILDFNSKAYDINVEFQNNWTGS